MGSSTSDDRKPWARSLHVDQYVDVLDTANKWSEAVVIGLTQHKVHVHFRGWSARFNEWIPFDSPRLAPAYSRARNWRVLTKGERVQLATEVSGAKSPVWREGVVLQTRRGRSDSDVPASVLVQLDGDRETRWVDTEEDCLCAAGTHQIHRRAAAKRSAGKRRDDESDEEADGDDQEQPETIVLSDDEESDEATTGSSDDARHATARGGTTVTRTKRPLTRAGSKPVAAKPSSPVARPRRDDRTKERAPRKRKHDDDDDFATWREGLAEGVELEVADEKRAQWYEARVVGVRGKREVCVRFRGWPWRYDEWLLRASERLAPSATHLGRWRDFSLKQPVQIGFRASARAEAPSRWETGVVTRVSKSVQTRQVKRVEVEWTSADGTPMREWRDANDDLLARVGMQTYPLPKHTRDAKMVGSGGPAFGGGSGDDDDDDDDGDTAYDDAGMEMALDLGSDPDDADGSHDSLPPSLADMLSLTPDDIAKAIEEQPVGPLAEAPAPTHATSATSYSTMRTQIRRAITMALDSTKGGLLAAVDAAFGTTHSLASCAGAPPLEPQGQQQQDDTDDTQAAPVAKRARRKREEPASVDGGGGVANGNGNSNGNGAAGDAGPAATDDAHARVQPAEI